MFIRRQLMRIVSYALTTWALVAAAYACEAHGSTLTIQPVTQFGINRFSTSAPPRFQDYPVPHWRVQHGAGADWLDEAFFEFPINALPAATSVVLTFEIENPPGNELSVERTFQLSTYAASGIPSLSRLGGGQFAAEFFIAGGPQTNMSRRQIFSIDVTAQVAAGVANGDAALGFRLHTPNDVTPGSDSVPIVYYTLDSAQLTATVPEPHGIALIGFVGGLSLARVRSMSRRHVRGN